MVGLPRAGAAAAAAPALAATGAFAEVEPEAVERLGVAKLTRAHVAALQSLAAERWSGRCAVLHDATGEPSEIYFWGSSGD